MVGDGDLLVRASAGTLATIGLIDMCMASRPTTAYLLQYSAEGCSAGCSFCPQSMGNKGKKELLSRIPWPTVELEELIAKLRRNNPFQRICLQTVLKPGFEEELVEAVRLINSSNVAAPVSVASTPIRPQVLNTLRRLKVDRIGVGLDVTSEQRFESVKKPFKYLDFWNFITDSLKAFGYRHVTVHLIFGLGESEVEFAKTMERIYDMGAEVALFPFTPIAGTPMEGTPQPELGRYRMMQIIRQNLHNGRRLEEVVEVAETISLKKDLEWEDESRCFLTSGCPGCNRPFYNERPGRIYNYPSKRLLNADKEAIQEQVGGLFRRRG